MSAAFSGPPTPCDGAPWLFVLRAEEQVAARVERPAPDLGQKRLCASSTLARWVLTQVEDGQLELGRLEHPLHRDAVDEVDPRAQDLVAGDDPFERAPKQPLVERAAHAKQGRDVVCGHSRGRERLRREK